MSSGKRESKTSERREHWRRVIGEQQASGQSIRGFCRQLQVPEHSFYMWRKALGQESQPIRFALVETRKLVSRPSCGFSLKAITQSPPEAITNLLGNRSAISCESDRRSPGKAITFGALGPKVIEKGEQ